jgi:hypothetical protein
VPPLNDLAEDGGDVEGEDGLEEWRRLELHGGQVQVGEHVQHLGVWVLLAILVQLGLYRCVMQSTARKDRPSMRVVLDSLVVALALGEGCVEGVRRVATPSASRLLRARRCPSPNWARRVLGKLGEAKGDEVQWNATRALIEGVKTFAEEAVVFYVDNHARPYTGKHTVRKVWRMQDKRARPGSTDFYVHDEEGRPVWRVEVPANEPLTKWLTPIARELREAVGPELPILLAFDRAGAFPEQLASLRNEGFHFVTYERKPYQKLASALFDTSIEVDGETYRVYERRRNLGRGRGRVWRLALRTPEDEQVNLLVMSDLSAEFLTTKMFGRWNQENGFKHGVGRWGINQLDGRKAAHYPPETIIPNPARRRLDRALRLARRREGDARSKLAAVDDDHPRRDALERDLEDALEEQRRLLAMRPQMPTHAPLAETELAGKLVHHTGHLKQVVDVVRMMCANAEAELAALLGPHLPRAAEAKKALATLFAAPGNIRLRHEHVAISLRPAGTKAERFAFSRLCRSLDSMDLTLPGDPSGRRLRFQIGN